MPPGSVIVTHSVAATFEFPIQTCSNVAAVLRTPNSSGGQQHLLDVLTSSSMLARGTAYPSWLVGRCQGATEGCTVLQSALRRRLHEEVVALNGHQTAKRIDQALMENFPKRVLYMAMQARLGKRTLLAGEMVGDSIQPTRGSFFFARCALGNWLAMGGSQPRGRCQRVPARISAHVASNGDDVVVESVPQPQSTESLFEQSNSTMFRNRFGLVQKM